MKRDFVTMIIDKMSTYKLTSFQLEFVKKSDFFFSDQNSSLVELT